MRITYASSVVVQCSMCGHQSVYFFHNQILCIARNCGWEAKREEYVDLPRPVDHAGQQAWKVVTQDANKKRRRRGRVKIRNSPPGGVGTGAEPEAQAEVVDG
jgi:hypothetical protein